MWKYTAENSFEARLYTRFAKMIWLFVTLYFPTHFSFDDIFQW